MKIGQLEIGWSRLDENERVALGLDPWPAGWEAFCIEWRGHGWMIATRPRKESRNER